MTVASSMALPDLLPITPFTHPVNGAVALPGSKSITNRALLLAALCDEPVILQGSLFSEDTHLMAEALCRLGFGVTADEAAGTLNVSGQRQGFGSQTPVDLFVGLAGTAARFLTAFCAAAPQGTYRLDGVPQMRQRPMKPLIDALRALGADIRCTGAEGFFPLEVRARGLAGGAVEIDASESSQLLSALLMVAPLARGDIRITLRGTVRRAYVDLTASMMQAFQRDGHSLVAGTGAETFTVKAQAKPYAFAGRSYQIEADASAATYFLALPLVGGGQLTLVGAQDAKRGLQGDTEFTDVVRAIGAQVQPAERGLEVSFVAGHARIGLDRNFKAISDTFLTLAALAPLLQGSTKISGIAHTRKQETDRVAGMAKELGRLGQHVIETEDALEIQPRPLRSGQTVETYGDHRFAMSFGILGCHNLHGDGTPWLTIQDPACCAKTFPHFFELLESVRRKSLAS
ncbi:MAG: 3-phosphoshikimate 1-carboxyvinyltransferase [Opitutus sp.]|nr:3-phosphoshikimate 1-carboxyvinyltransferase [Opitutus sp.]